jgi:5'(3')-deoxyribonucleotidase
MRILIDVDNTLCDNMAESLKIYNFLYHDDLKVSDIKSWDIGKYLKAGAEKDFFDVCLPNSYKTAKPYGYAEQAIRRFSEKHEIMYVTSGYYVEKLEWLMLWHFLQGSVRNPTNVIICKQKWWIRGDVMIDDYPKNLLGREHTILFDQPWNQDDSKAIRVRTWIDVEDEIDKIEKENRNV